MKAIHKKRLLNVAKACRETKFPKAFTMSQYTRMEGDWPCGTPGCALGNYAARRDLQRGFLIDSYGNARDRVCGLGLLPAAERHFGLAFGEVHRLFGPNGCGSAKTAKQAARFIENFVKRKERKA